MSLKTTSSALRALTGAAAVFLLAPATFAQTEPLLTPGQPAPFSYPARAEPTVYYGAGSFRFVVPEGATSAQVAITETSGTASMRIFAKFGQSTVINGQFGADYASFPSASPVLTLRPPQLRAGTYYLAIGVETLNRAVSGTILLTMASSTGPAPDLVPTLLESPGRGLIGRRIANSVRVTNRGPGPAPASTTGYYFSRDPNSAASDVNTFWTCQLPELAVNAVGGCSGEVGVPPTLTPGDWVLKAVVDPANAVSEANENNNVMTAGPISLRYPLPYSITAFPVGLGFTTPLGSAAPPAQDLVISGLAGRRFRARSSNTWLTISASTGTTPQTLRVSVNPQGLAIGHYSGEVVVAPEDDPENARYVPVGFTVSDPAGTAAVYTATPPTQLDFTYAQGSGVAASRRVPVSLTVAIYALISTNEGDANWVWGNWSPDGLTVSSAGVGLGLGRYRGTVMLFCPRCTTPLARVPVELSVIAGTPPAVNQVRAGGGGQTGAAGSKLPVPVTAEVLNASGRPVADAEVTFTGENATVDPPTTRTNAAGMAFGTVTLGSAPGRATITVASAGAPPASVTATVAGGGSTGSEIAVTDVVDGAGFQPSIAPGGWVTIRGLRLSRTTRTWESRDFAGDRLPTALDGVSVTIGGRPAAVHYISPAQLNVLAPMGLTAGTATVSVTSPDGTASRTVTVEAVRPAFFLFEPENRRYLAAVHLDGRYVGKPGLFAGSPNLTAPLVPGRRALLFGAGWGGTSPAIPEGSNFSTALPLTSASGVRITIGGQPATVEFAGAVGPGLYQFNIVTPNLPAGDHAVVGEVNGVRSQANVFVTVGSAPAAAIASLSPASGAVGRTIDSLMISAQNLSEVTGVTMTPSAGIAEPVVERSDAAAPVRLETVQLNMVNGQGRRSNKLEGVY